MGQTFALPVGRASLRPKERVRLASVVRSQVDSEYCMQILSQVVVRNNSLAYVGALASLGGRCRVLHFVAPFRASLFAS